MKALKKCNNNINFSEPFKNLFTHGMVCHETYKDKNGEWLYPEEVEKITADKIIKRKDKSEVKIGPSESMSKSKKNTVDPETMIKQYGADAVRWFILSDSPPEKDVQWSDTGVSSSNKFLQKIWNLNQVILKMKQTESSKEEIKNFENKIDLYVYKIDKAINNFHLNVAIANFYETYKFFNDSLKLKISKNVFIENLTKIMKLMTPFVPHLAYECLSNLNCKNSNIWPKINEKALENINVNMAVQINGKTREILSVKKDLSEKELNSEVIKSTKASKYISDKKIVKTIFIKNKIINYIIN